MDFLIPVAQEPMVVNATSINPIARGRIRPGRSPTV